MQSICPIGETHVSLNEMCLLWEVVVLKESINGIVRKEVVICHGR